MTNNIARKTMVSFFALMMLLAGCDLFIGDRNEAQQLFDLAKNDTAVFQQLVEMAKKNQYAAFFAGVIETKKSSDGSLNTKAREFYAKANRIKEAQYNLALDTIFNKPDSTQSEVASAIATLDKLLSQDFWPAAMLLGYVYDNGARYVAVNKSLADTFYRRAVQQYNIGDAADKLGEMYQKGEIGSGVDLQTARYFTEIGAKLGITADTARMAELSTDKREQAKWYVIAALVDPKYALTAKESLAPFIEAEQNVIRKEADLWLYVHKDVGTHKIVWNKPLDNLYFY